VLSSSDLKALGYNVEMFSLFDLTVSEFLAQVRAKQPPDFPKVLAVTPDTTIATVAKLFEKNKVHRLFVVENVDSMKPIGVISLFDFLVLFGSSHQ